MRFVPSAVSRKVAQQALLGRKHSPTVLFGVGVAGMVGSTVLACRATLRLEEVLKKTNNDLSIADSLQDPGYSENDRDHDLMVIKVRGAVEVAKLYAPSVALGAISIGALTQSHNILSRRNAALAAAYTALDRGFALYRERVVERYGEEIDRDLRYGSETAILTDQTTGARTNLHRVGSGEPSIYSRFFDPLCSSWSKEPEYNLLFLRCQQNYANDLLKARGHVFLNEVYAMLGIPHSKAGAVVGWVLGTSNSDNYIDFGVFEGESQTARDFVNGREGAILLDFNVDGLIFDLIENRRPVAWQS